MRGKRSRAFGTCCGSNSTARRTLLRGLVVNSLLANGCATKPVEYEDCLLYRSDEVLEEIASGELAEHAPATERFMERWRVLCTDG